MHDVVVARRNRQRGKHPQYQCKTKTTGYLLEYTGNHFKRSGKNGLNWRKKSWAN